MSLVLGKKLGLPAIHLDVLYWRPGWKPSDLPDFRARVSEAIAGDGWIVDGSFSGLAMDLTRARADLFISIERRGQRTDLPEGCPEEFDWSIVKQAWRWNIDRAPNIEAERLQFGAQIPVVRLRSDMEIAAFLNSPFQAG